MRIFLIKHYVTVPMFAIMAVASHGAFAGQAPISAIKETRDTRTVAVSYADLNLSTDEGVQRLNRRVSKAAATVCNVRSAIDLHEDWAARKCYRGAMSGAMQKVQLAVSRFRSGEQLASLDRDVAISQGQR